MLFALLVNRDTFEDQIIVVLRGDGAWLENWILDAILGHTAFDEFDFHMNPASHFNRTAERNFAIALAKVQVTD